MSSHNSSLVDRLIKYNGDKILPNSFVFGDDLPDQETCHICNRLVECQTYSVGQEGPISGSLYFIYYYAVCDRKRCRAKLKQIMNILFPDAKALKKIYGFELCNIERAYEYILSNHPHFVEVKQEDLDCIAHIDMSYLNMNLYTLCVSFSLYSIGGYSGYNYNISLFKLQSLGCNKIYNDMIKKLISKVVGNDVAGIINDFL
jgi:hypothetical protein